MTSTLYSTRVPFLSRLRTVDQRPAVALVWPKQQQHSSTAHQIGVRDKCPADSSSSPVTYLCFSRNFTRLSVPLQKWPYSALWSDHGAVGSLATATTRSQTVPNKGSHLKSEGEGSTEHWVNWHQASGVGGQHRPNVASSSTSRTDGNHRSSGRHLVLHLSAAKLTGNFASSLVVTSAATWTGATNYCSSHWARIGAIKGTTRTTRDTRNNKWTSFGRRTRPQHEEQVPPPVAEAARFYAWQASHSAEPPLGYCSALTSSPSVSRNAFNKLMSKKTTMGAVVPRRMISSTSHTGQLPPLVGAASARNSAVSSAVICKSYHRLLQRALLACHQSTASLWTSSGRFDSTDGGAGQSGRCWRCDKPINSEPSAAPSSASSSSSTAANSTSKVAKICAKCGSLQPISVDVNFFALFSLPSDDFDVDLAQLRQQYLRLQQNMHPDMNVNRSNTETAYSLDNSSIINSAYKTLRDPYQRALYLLRKRYDITIDEGATETEPELLLEIMELNEDIELATDKDRLMDVWRQVEAATEAIVASLKTAFAADNAIEARRLVVRFAYYNSLVDKLRGQLASVQ